VLITAGNVVETTFFGVCYAVREVLGNSIDAIHIFDTPLSAAQAEESRRTVRIREMLGDVEIRTRIVTDQSVQMVIPDNLSRLLREFGRDKLIVDLSNGQKLTTSVLYAVATISRLPNIFVLEFAQRPTQDTHIEQLARPSDWDYVRIEPLREILSITHSSHIDLIYYRDRIDEIMSSIQTRNPTFSDEIKDRLDLSLIDYFTTSSVDNNQERLERCINGLGKVCEDVAIQWHRYCCKEQIIATTAHDFNSRVQQIMKRWGDYRKQAASGKLDTSNSVVRDAVIPTLSVDTQLGTMQVYRNMASHSSRYYQLSRADARVAFGLTLLILERVSESAIANPLEVMVLND